MNTLIVVDVQNDFCPGGALAVSDGNAIVPIINTLMPRFDLVVATQDWHPADHKSFASNFGGAIGDVVQLAGLAQVLWPDHCVQGTSGAEFVAELESAHFDKVFQKGTDSEIDSYSGFFDNGQRKSTRLHDFLQERGVQEVYVVGLATDYCVKATALDAARLGYKTTLIEDACRGVNLTEGDAKRAVQEMENAGVKIMQSVNIGF